jgi:hypothetical protein
LDIEPYKVLYQGFGGFGEINLLEILSARLEPLHAFLISILKSLGLGFSSYLLITAVIPFYYISKVLIAKVNYPALSLYFFLLATSYPAMDAVRHFVAAGIYLYALYRLSARRVAAYHGYAFFSFFAHYSNAITFIMAPLLKVRWRIGTYLSALLGAIFVALVTKELVSALLENLAQGSDLAILFKVNYYINHTDAYEYLNPLHFWIFNIKLYFGIVFVVILNFLALNSLNTVYKSSSFRAVLINSQIIGSILAVFLMGFGAVDFSGRINFLMSIGSFIIIADLVQNENGKIDALKFSVMSFLAFGLGFINLLYLIGIHQPMSPFFLG